MCDSSSETQKKVAQRSRKASSSAKEADDGNSSGGCQLKKGPWTAAEDAILVDYVTIHGEGNWNAVQKYSGLSRCGKSCRLRWANHLRPELKKGLFSPEEEKLIIELHFKMGNKWARMATELPGRTDNEIKNFWNTRIKKLQRAGLPTYPPDVVAEARNESLQCQDIPSQRSAGTNLPDASRINHLEIPLFDFKKLGQAQGYLNSPSFLSLQGRSILCKDTSPALDFLLPLKRPRETETTYVSYGDFADGQSFWSPSFDSDLQIKDPSPVDILCGSHAHTNGKSPSSDPISISMAKKMELPSLQLSASQVGSWASSSPLPSLDSADLIQSPFSEQTQSNCPSPRSCGLLDAVVYESHLKKLKSKFSPPIPAAPIDCADSLDSISPLSQSAASVLLEYNTPPSGSCSDEPETIQGFKGKTEMGSADLRPDMLLDSCWIGFPGLAKEHSITDTDDVGPLFVDDVDFEYAQVGSLSSESNQSNVLGSSSSPWDDASDLFQFSDHL